MNKKNYKYIYGPVPSWRLGSSLGIDPISGKDKICSFDCVYCQLGRTKSLTDERKIFIPTEEIIEELNYLPFLDIDYITFSGRGEPTLAENIGRTIRAIKEIRKDKIAVITNSSLLTNNYVCDDLLAADSVIAKLDACCQDEFECINRPIKSITFDKVVKAIKNFKSIYKGELALQIMFIENNKASASKIAEITREINPDQVQINTPLRPCPVKPLAEDELSAIESCFGGLEVITVYKARKKKVKSVSKEDTLRRRGKV